MNWLGLAEMFWIGVVTPLTAVCVLPLYPAFISYLASTGGDAEWHLSASEAQAVVDTAIEHGITFFDTANAYNTGASERVLGEALSDYDQDRQVVATKVYFGMDDANPNAGGLSRKAIEQELANSLDRLGMETIDLYQIHR